MIKKFKVSILPISAILISALHLSIAFAKNSPSKYLFDIKTVEIDSSVAAPVIKSAYDSLQLDMMGLSKEAFIYAKEGFDKLIDEGKLLNDQIITIVDFSKPSKEKRLFIIDLKNYTILYNTLVAHGSNTGREWATNFSNNNSSHQSSPGFYITLDTYQGKNGYSLKLEGLEKGINDNALERGIVIHGANYVSKAMANSQGFIGRSWGCPAVPAELTTGIINTIKSGSCLFIYHPSYIAKSKILS